MAKELQFFGDKTVQSGLTVTVDIYDANLNLVTNNLATTEVPGEAIYYADMPAHPAGEYSVRFEDGTAVIGQGAIIWDGTKEVISEILIDELHKLQGLDINNPMTVTPTNRSVGTIDLDITGDGESLTVVTRQ